MGAKTVLVELGLVETYPLEQVRAAYGGLANGHLLGKIVLIP